MSLSVAIITYNEEDNLRSLLHKIDEIADEIIIVDSYSTDNTKKTATQNPKVKFIENKFVGFGAQKNFAIQQCQHDWILFLDADERPDETAIKSIASTVNDPESASIYKIKFQHILFGKPIKYGGWGNTYRERLFKKSKAKYSDDAVHEKLLYDEPAKIIKGKLKHYTYKNAEHHVAKINSYSSLMALKLHEKGKKTNPFIIFIKQQFQFIKSYFLQLGFLDGLVGYHAAKTTAFYTYLKYMKLYELRNVTKVSNNDR